MKRSYLIAVLVLFITFLTFSQGKSSIQFSGGVIYHISSSSGLSGGVQFNYFINTRYNFFVSADYSEWDIRYFRYSEENVIRTASSESDHRLSRIMAGGRYMINQSAQFKLFVEAGIGYSYLQYTAYKYQWMHDSYGNSVLGFYPQIIVHQNLFNFNSGIGFIHPITKSWDILFEFKLNTYLNSEYNGLFSSYSTFSSFNFGFNYKI